MSKADETKGCALGQKHRSAARVSAENCVSDAARKIALFSAYYPSHGGGMEMACAELARGFRAAGMNVEWVAQADNDIPFAHDAHCIAVPGTDIIYALSGVPLPLPMPWGLPKIWNAAKRADVVVIVEANFILSAISFAAAKWNYKPILLVQHVGKPSTVSKLARWIMRIGERAVVRPMVRGADVFVCVSPVVARHFEGERGTAPSHTIGHGIDMECFRSGANGDERQADRRAFGRDHREKIACFVGRLTESKGVMAIAEMARLRPDWTFLLAGIGPVDPSQWGLPNVVVLGQLDRESVAQLYRVSDVMVLPSQSESFSLVVREALASGCRVICSDQILDTDAGLAPFVTTVTVDLADVPGTAARFAMAFERYPRATASEARQYLADHCSPAAVNDRYARLVKALLPGQDEFAG